MLPTYRYRYQGVLAGDIFVNSVPIVYTYPRSPRFIDYYTPYASPLKLCATANKSTEVVLTYVPDKHTWSVEIVLPK